MERSIMSKMTRPRKKPRGRKDYESAVLKRPGEEGLGSGVGKEDMGFSRQPTDQTFRS